MKGEKRIVLELTPKQLNVDHTAVEKTDAQIREEAGHPEGEPSEVARSLRAARLAAGMSLADVAERAGMTKQAILHIETGMNSNPKINTLMRVANALDKSIRIKLVNAV